ncbi:alpha/beta hydrolase [Aurantivibrio plasticivorans]
MSIRLIAILRVTGGYLLTMLLGVLVALIAVLYFYANSQPELNPWHAAPLDNEFGEREFSQFIHLDEYLALEAKLFHELNNRIYDKAPANASLASRFTPGSPVDPTGYMINWNRTQILAAGQNGGEVKAKCLLVHGLTDSPYSLRSLAETLQAEGCSVVALRLPGHGTIPAGLLNIENKYFSRAVELAARYLHEETHEALPFYVVGYSTGATLAIEYAVKQISSSSETHQLLASEVLPPVDKLVLISPAMGLPKVAEFASWQRRAAKLPGLGVLAWNALLPEYDPYKYNSFTINAAEQVYQLTQKVSHDLAQWRLRNPHTVFPDTLTFMSAVDATVSVEAVVHDLYWHLNTKQHELVVYDIDRTRYTPYLYNIDAMKNGLDLLNAEQPFSVTVVSNQLSKTNQLQVMKRVGGTISANEVNLNWPGDIYSLSHTALPIKYNDPIYGDSKLGEPGGVPLGGLNFKGERGILRIPPAQMNRLRYNPFYGYQEKQILLHLNLDNAH